MSDYLEYRRALKNGQAPPAEKKKPAKIRPVSKKRAVINRQYDEVAHLIWKGKPCACKTPVCTGKAQGIHHPHGKENTKKLLDPDNMMACCHRCNTWIEDNDAQARRMGLKKSKFKSK